MFYLQTAAYAIAYFEILGRPVVFYLGIIAFFSFCFTASIALLNRRGIHKIPLKWHFRLAKISLGLAATHGLLAFLANL